MHIVNRSASKHPWHLHGQFFSVISRQRPASMVAELIVTEDGSCGTRSGLTRRSRLRLAR